MTSVPFLRIATTIATLLFSSPVCAAADTPPSRPLPLPSPPAHPPSRPAPPLPFHVATTSAQPLAFAALSVAAAQTAAIAASPDVAGARARLLQSQSALAAARAGTGLSLVSNYAQVPQGNPPGPNIISRQLNAGLQIAVGDFIARSPAVREAAYLLAAAQADGAAAETTERVKTIGLYFDALKARAVASARRDALALATSQFEAARIRAGAGDAPQLDIVRADVAVAKATADLESATAADLNASEALRIETNSPEETLATTAPFDFPAVDPQLTDPPTVIGLARAARPEIVAAGRTANAAQAAIRSARAAGFPTLTVSGGYLLGTDSDVPINAPALSAQLTIPFSSGNRERIAVAAAKALEARSKAAGIERQILLDVAASARTLGASQRVAVATSRARGSASAELRATELGYRNGASSSLERTTARSTYTQAVVDELSARYDLEKARATLDVEVGR